MQNFLSSIFNLSKLNIARSEQSSHTPGGSHQMPYHFNWKETLINKGTDKQYVAEFLYTVKLVISDVCTKFQNSR